MLARTLDVGDVDSLRKLAADLLGDLAVDLLGNPAADLLEDLAVDLLGNPAADLMEDLAVDLLGNPAADLLGDLEMLACVLIPTPSCGQTDHSSCVETSTELLRSTGMCQVRFEGHRRAVPQGSSDLLSILYPLVNAVLSVVSLCWTSHIGPGPGCRQKPPHAQTVRCGCTSVLGGTLSSTPEPKSSSSAQLSTAVSSVTELLGTKRQPSEMGLWVSLLMTCDTQDSCRAQEYNWTSVPSQNLAPGSCLDLLGVEVETGRD
ncbi:hypothetical protein STEG23_007845 [Scotinomys teguina]